MYTVIPKEVWLVDLLSTFPITKIHQTLHCMYMYPKSSNYKIIFTIWFGARKWSGKNSLKHLLSIGF